MVTSAMRRPYRGPLHAAPVTGATPLAYGRHRFPVDHRDEDAMPHPTAPVRTAAQAMHIIGLAMRQPPGDETICFALDDNGVGGVAIAIGDTTVPDDLLDVIEIIGRAAVGTPAVAIVVATVRACGGVRNDDGIRWEVADAVARHHGLELLEWFVIDAEGHVHLPRLLVGDASRWPGTAGDDLPDPSGQVTFGDGAR